MLIVATFELDFVAKLGPCSIHRSPWDWQQGFSFLVVAEQETGNTGWMVPGCEMLLLLNLL